MKRRTLQERALAGADRLVSALEKHKGEPIHLVFASHLRASFTFGYLAGYRAARRKARKGCLARRDNE